MSESPKLKYKRPQNELNTNERDNRLLSTCQMTCDTLILDNNMARSFSGKQNTTKSGVCQNTRIWPGKNCDCYD